MHDPHGLEDWRPQEEAQEGGCLILGPYRGLCCPAGWGVPLDHGGKACGCGGRNDGQVSAHLSVCSAPSSGCMVLLV